MDYRPKCKSSNYKASRKRLKKITVALSLGKISLKKNYQNRKKIKLLKGFPGSSVVKNHLPMKET